MPKFSPYVQVSLTLSVDEDHPRDAESAEDSVIASALRVKLLQIRDELEEENKNISISFDIRLEGEKK